jgi:hypothetical protein
MYRGWTETDYTVSYVLIIIYAPKMRNSDSS